MAVRWRLLCAVPVALLCGSGGSYTIGLGSYSRPDREHAYRALAEYTHPVWRELWDSRVGLGDRVEELIARTQPPRVERAGRFVRLSYDPHEEGGLNVIARDGRLISAQAGSCIWSHTFFTVMTAADWAEFKAAEEAQRVAGLGR